LVIVHGWKDFIESEMAPLLTRGRRRIRLLLTSPSLL